MPEVILQNGDNFDFLKDEQVDFILTDPPFNISQKTNFASYEKNSIHSYQFDESAGESWDSFNHDEFLVKLDDWSREWHRVLRRGGSFAIFCADIYISHLMEALKRNGLRPRRLITWRKNNAVPVNRKYMPMSANEYIVVGVKDGKNVVFNSDVPIAEQSLEHQILESTIVADKVSTIVYSQIRESLLDMPEGGLFTQDHLEEVVRVVEQALERVKLTATKKVAEMYKIGGSGLYLQACVPNYIQNPLKVGNRIHPTEKPVPLLEVLVSLYSKQGDVVLDGFAGSGSTGEAALRLGRNAILVERDSGFFAKLTDRLTRAHPNVRIL